jgi:hypothetical protein
MMGKSVMIGARATFMPALLSWLRVSEITRARIGPGAKPAERPSIIPVVRKVTMPYLLQQKNLPTGNHSVFDL